MSTGRRLSSFIPLVIGLAFAAAGYYTDPAALTDDGYPLNYFFYFMGACFGLPGLLTLFGTVFVQGRQEQNLNNLLQTGQKGIASIVTLEDTGVRINDNPRVSMMLEIHLDGHPPYRVEKTMTVPLIYLPQVQPGQTILVVADPHDPDRVELLLGGSTG